MDQFKQPNDIKSLLKRYLLQQTTAEENKRVNHWYDQLPDSAQSGLSEEERAALQKSILQQVHAATAPVKPLRRWLSYAAAVLAVVGVAGYLYRTSDAAPEIVQTGNAVTRRIVLPDSSIVVLNAGSRLSIDAAFGKTARNLSLEGEAFFDVKSDPNRPFRVHYKQLTTTVVGTAFNIRAYPNEQLAKIAVASGGVKVMINEDGEHASLLKQHETLQYSTSTGSVVKGFEDPQVIGQWQKRILSFNGNTLPEIVAEISRQYPDKIRLYSTAADTIRYSIVFRQEKLTNILHVLAGLTGITYKNAARQINIYSKTYGH
ncbi:FecR family protein [Chitinophaga eiseniae]|uniref:DUF4974 domain-containing protein n=1 Tax=Chitinophaga eiseniae TaxID=634771 RepID=A0A847SXK0_9BACT|nr:FecR domain-containing protein [Chitinophaga eiseniae]NLR82312.1 DUF4974 domain-containing protein [Chitinophaga eiseniae]